MREKERFWRPAAVVTKALQGYNQRKSKKKGRYNDRGRPSSSPAASIQKRTKRRKKALFSRQGGGIFSSQGNTTQGPRKLLEGTVLKNRGFFSSAFCSEVIKPISPNLSPEEAQSYFLDNFGQMQVVPCIEMSVKCKRRSIFSQSIILVELSC